MFVSKPTELTRQIIEKKATNARGDKLVKEFSEHIEDISSLNYFSVKEVEELLLKEKEHEVSLIGKFPDYPRNMPKFSPSSAGKCERELFYKAAKLKQDEQTTYPFQNRWTRNSSAVHGAMQKTLLEAEHLLSDPKFKVQRMDNGLPAWERNVEKWKVITHNGVQFVLFGMCDGLMEYADGTAVGFEYKTKSNSVAQIKQIKDINQYINQVISYAILFDVDEWLVTVESVAKDKWSTNENARPDFKVFYHKVTQKEKNMVLDKFARIAMNLQDGEVSVPDYTKCTFCPFKTQCHGEESA